VAKGNHVFNSFDKSIISGFEAFLLGANVVVTLSDAVNSSSSEGAKKLVSLYPSAWPKYKEIIKSAAFTQLHKMQDSNTVPESDPNSQAFGKDSKEFVAQMGNMGKGSSNNPGAAWKKMLASGYDGQAAYYYIKDTLNPGDETPKQTLSYDDIQVPVTTAEPNSKEKRLKLVNSMSAWLKGGLTHNVDTWISYLRWDVSRGLR